MAGRPRGRGGSSGWVASITKLLDDMRAWSDANRGGSFPAGVAGVVAGGKVTLDVTETPTILIVDRMEPWRSRPRPRWSVTVPSPPHWR